jgi:hypothetical protein
MNEKKLLAEERNEVLYSTTPPQMIVCRYHLPRRRFPLISYNFGMRLACSNAPLKYIPFGLECWRARLPWWKKRPRKPFQQSESRSQTQTPMSLAAACCSLLHLSSRELHGLLIFGMHVSTYEARDTSNWLTRFDCNQHQQRDELAKGDVHVIHTSTTLKTRLACEQFDYLNIYPLWLWSFWWWLWERSIGS